MKKLNFNLEDKLYITFKKFCIDQEETMTNILIKLIKKEIKDEQK